MPGEATKRGDFKPPSWKDPGFQRSSFDLQFVTLGPSLRGKQPAVRLEEGLEVGFDVGWTSRGLRASRFFIAPPASEGKAGQERDVAPDEGPGQDEYQLDIE